MDSAPAAWRSTPARMLGGSALGAVTWPADLLLSAVALTAPAAPSGPVSTLVAWHRRRTSRFLGWVDDGAPLTSARAAGYLFARAGVGVLGTLVLGLLAYGLFAVVAGLASWLFDVRFTVVDPDGAEGLTTGALLAMVPLGAVLLYLDLMGLAGVGVLDRAAAARWLAPSRSERLAAQVESLTVSRAELLAALDAERGRIERDLHDGVQQRAVAVGLLVDRARRAVAASGGTVPGTGTAGARLLEQAAREVELLVSDLREVAWRVRPTTLDTHGLEPVLRQLVERAAVPTVLEWAVAAEPSGLDSSGIPAEPARLPGGVEATVYYVVAEALTNVARHSGARTARVGVALVDPGTTGGNGDDAVVRVVVCDDGVGGARPQAGHGLAGLAGRVAAAGGTLTVDSPAGGPTRIEVTLPCA
ncbi:sensor histidine kinase [Promicromonospora sp. NPDC052451]|uniref:sensor histidine kinase n=1 Tax=Promicromonospora sp. NPDC052451 TaxID=3364407 RepID=UPI0037C74120